MKETPFDHLPEFWQKKIKALREEAARHRRDAQLYKEAMRAMMQNTTGGDSK